MKQKYKILFYLITITLAFVLSSSFQALYELFFGPVPGGFFVPLENTEGFVLGLVFFITIAIIFFPLLWWSGF